MTIAPLLAGLLVSGVLSGSAGRPVPRDDLATVSPDAQSPVEGTNVRIDVRDAATGEPIPAKLTILGVGTTPNPYLGSEAGRPKPWGVLSHHRVFAGHGRGSFRVVPGRYDVWVSRGLEWTRAVARAVVVGARPLVLKARLRRAVSLPGWSSADLHVHTRNSLDSYVHMRARVHQFAAAGVEVVVATDHNHITDLGPTVAREGLGRHLLAVPGQELTTHLYGHFGAWPLPHNPRYPKGGSLPTGSPAGMMAKVREVSPGAAVVLNHPWRPKSGYFVRGKLDRATGSLGRQPFVFGFDALELLNGYEMFSTQLLDEHLKDWFALLTAGRRITATGNSDTHHLGFNQGGYPRNYLRTGAESLVMLTAKDLARAIKAQRGFFTTGPLVQLTLARADSVGPVADLGDTITPGQGPLTAHVRVQAVPWVDVSEVRLWVGGELHKRWEVTPSTRAVRLDEVVTISLQRETFVVVTVKGRKSLWPVVGERGWRCYPDKRSGTKQPKKGRRRSKRCVDVDIAPVAVTNPIFVRP